MENSRLVEQLEKEVTHHRNAVDKKDQELMTAAHQNEAEVSLLSFSTMISMSSPGLELESPE